MDDEIWRIELTMWGVMAAVLDDYGIDTAHITGKIGDHLADDMMEALARDGHIRKVEDDG